MGEAAREESPLISVIVPVYKVEEYLARCVDSILGQTYRNLEILLVDDGSPDRCGAMCDEYAARDSRIRVLHKENGGLSSARNAAIDVARGEYIGFVDSDDWIEPETYEALLDMALAEKVKLVCGGRFDISSRTGEKNVGLCPPKREVISGEALCGRIFLWDNVDSAAWDKLYHHTLFREIRYPIGKICEDLPTTYRIALDAGRVGMLNKPLYNYFHRPGSITMAGFSAKNLHAAQHSRAVLADIRQNHPALRKRAEYFHVWQLGHTLQRMDLAGGDVKKEFAAEYQGLLRELRSFVPFLLTSPLPHAQQRLTWLLICVNAYGPLRKLYHLGR